VNKKYLLLLALLLKASLMVFFISLNYIGLGPDEAQYWTWSQKLDIGYYSKPPAIAWQIYLGCKMLGHCELGVRFFSVILSFLQAFSLFILAKKCGLKDLTAFFAGLSCALSPLGIFGSLLATTDGGLLLFWTLASIPLLSALKKNQPPNYLYTALALLVGALFKWPIYLFWLIVIFLKPFIKELQGKHLIRGIGLSFLGLLPSILWNIDHDFATFKHVLATITKIQDVKEASFLFKGNPLDFLGAQAALFSPILFVLLLFSFFKKGKEPPQMRFCCLSTLLILAIYFALSFFKKIQGNWALFAYPLAFVYLSYFIFEKEKKYARLYQGGVMLSLALNLFALSIPLLPLPYSLNPFRHNLGWYYLEQKLKNKIFSNTFLLSDSYQMTSVLSFYNSEKKRALFLNIKGARKNQFSFWPTLFEEKGYYLCAENTPHLQKFDVEKKTSELQNYFKEVCFIEEIPLVCVKGTIVKKGFLFECTNFLGTLPFEDSGF
jgi:4-amino-4-deoxy-L-arabinose transferase-like glycosyltransferase